MERTKEHNTKITDGLKKYWSTHKKEPKKCPVCQCVIRPYAERCKKHRVFSETHRLKLSVSNLGKKQSLETLEKLSKIRTGKPGWCKGKIMPRGKNASNWRGGITKTNSLERKRVEARLWRESVFIRDDYTCQECEARGGILNAHHIKPFAEYPELRTDITNGITLCESCHIEEHKIINLRGSDNTTRR